MVIPQYVPAPGSLPDFKVPLEAAFVIDVYFFWRLAILELHVQVIAMSSDQSDFFHRALGAGNFKLADRQAEKTGVPTFLFAGAPDSATLYGPKIEPSRAVAIHVWLVKHGVDVANSAYQFNYQSALLAHPSIEVAKAVLDPDKGGQLTDLDLSSPMAKLLVEALACHKDVARLIWAVDAHLPCRELIRSHDPYRLALIDPNLFPADIPERVHRFRKWQQAGIESSDQTKASGAVLAEACRLCDQMSIPAANFLQLWDVLVEQGHDPYAKIDGNTTPDQLACASYPEAFLAADRALALENATAPSSVRSRSRLRG